MADHEFKPPRRLAYERLADAARGGPTN
ncbi:hypothetical protein RA210_U700003 [Rubrivivax sp. A210]|nr:hypothetical protein RA210_U700003 [Rubrivivax sp. A210]